jgi:hypothetical protein
VPEIRRPRHTVGICPNSRKKEESRKDSDTDELRSLVRSSPPKVPDEQDLCPEGVYPEVLCREGEVDDDCPRRALK